MRYGWQTALLALVAFLGVLPQEGVRADIVLSGNFGPNGDLGFVNSPPNLSVSFGAATGMGALSGLDGFVNVPGVDFGQGAGMSADLTNGAPTGLGYTFAASQPKASQLLLSYTFVNNTGAALAGFQFLQFTDADVNAATFNTDYATLHSPSALGQPFNPSSFQVGDPQNSTIFTNLMSGMLSNINEMASPATAGDASVALGFNYGRLGIGQSVTFDVLLADDGTSLSNFSINQASANFPGDSLTISGTVVPEPASIISCTVGSLMGLGYLVAHRRLRGRSRSRSRSRAQACTRSQ